MKKISYLLFTLFMLFVLASCSFVNITSTSKTNNQNNQNGNNYTSQKVTIQESTVEHSASTVEEVVRRVYDTVVVINARLTNGTSSGSGVIIGESEDKTYIITCFHVIEGANTLSVTLSDTSVYQAEVVGGDAVSDIAVICIEKTGLTIATFIDDSQKVTLASTAIAIGNPLGTLSGTVTVGIISNTNRIIQTDDGYNRDLIQTDAAINSGNSGGGLFNIDGQLIGIVNAKFSATGVEGLAFAIPANTAKSIAQGLITKGYVEGRYNLGVTFSNGYYRTGGFFSTTYKVVYASAIDPNGSCYGKLQLQDILVSVDVHYQDHSKQNVSLTTINDAQDVTNFFNNLNLEIGDVIVYNIKRGSYNATTTAVEVEVVQYIYGN